MKKKDILLDMDGCICDLATKWRQAYNDKFGANVSEELFFSKGNDVHTALGCGDEIYDIYKQPGFFSDLPPIPGAIETIKKYHEQHNIIILTALSCSGEIAKGKYEWLDHYMPFFNKQDVIFCKRKHLVYGDLLIEDNIKNLDRWKDAWPMCRGHLLINAGNKQFISYEMDIIYSWEDIDKILSVI